MARSRVFAFGSRQSRRPTSVLDSGGVPATGTASSAASTYSFLYFGGNTRAPLALLAGGQVGDQGQRSRANGLPPELAGLLREHREDARREAWRRFLEEHHALLLRTARSRGSPSRDRAYDRTMDRYVYVLERLQEDDYQRLRQYRPDEMGRFPTWLVVVARRLCVDWQRARYGRYDTSGSNGSGAEARHRRDARRRLLDLVGEELRPSLVPDSRQPTPERALRRKQLADALEEALDGLETEERLLLRLRFEDELSAREIAEILGFSSQFAVYRRIKALLSRLREELEGRGIRGPRP